MTFDCSQKCLLSKCGNKVTILENENFLTIFILNLFRYETLVKRDPNSHGIPQRSLCGQELAAKTLQNCCT